MLESDRGDYGLTNPQRRKDTQPEKGKVMPDGLFGAKPADGVEYPAYPTELPMNTQVNLRNLGEIVTGLNRSDN